ncbi:MAG: tetratricopeptide repeat protein [Chloroflexi bacterium]|nr:MAG: tetratricopeptide repeat protein [Chloroflexota bacterium]
MAASAQRLCHFFSMARGSYTMLFSFMLLAPLSRPMKTKKASHAWEASFLTSLKGYTALAPASPRRILPLSRRSRPRRSAKANCQACILCVLSLSIVPRFAGLSREPKLPSIPGHAIMPPGFWPMYIRPTKRRQSSPLRVLILLILVAAGGYVLVYRRDMIKPIQVGPTPTPTPTAGDVMAEAQGLYQAGDLDGAIAKYSEAAELDPTQSAPYTWWAHLLTLRGRSDEAIQKARQAVGLAPDSAPALAALCMALDWDAGAGDQAQLQDALSSCLSATDLEPTYAEGHAFLAEVYADLGQTSQAVEAARLAVSLDDSSPFAHRDLGYAFEKQRKYAEAVAEYQRASQIHPRLAQPYIDLGRIHMSYSRYNDALAALEKATVVDPNSAHAFDSLGWAYFQTGDHQRAAVVLKKATEVDPDYLPSFGHLGLTYYVLRNYEDAITAFKRALDLGSTELEYYYEIGLSYAYLDRCSEARPWLEKAVEMDASAWPAWEGLEMCDKK